VLFKVKEAMQVSEQDAADLLSEVLLDNQPLNDEFISVVEQIHMKARMMGVTFAIKSRDAKDRYIDANFKNTLSELVSDASVYGTEIALRKLFLSHIALNIAQNLGIDYHAATEELYYYMRKNDMQTHDEMMQSIRSLLTKRGVEKP
jgi:phosphoenolpyruvate carboxylase